MIINIAGTSGSGKSTIVKAIMDGAELITPHVGNNDKIVGYHCSGYGEKPLYIIGPYEKPTGGADNLQPLSRVFDVAKYEFGVTGNKSNVLLEGLLVSRSKGRLLDLWYHVNCRDFFVYQLNTSLDDCINSINLRRRARGNDKPVSRQRTEETFNRVNKICADLESAGVPVIRGTRAETLEAILKRLRTT